MLQLEEEVVILCAALCPCRKHYNEGRDIAGNIPPGYNSKLMALDKCRKAQMIVIDKELDQ